MLKFGSQSISGLRLGAAEIRKAYLGDTVVFDVTEPPVPAYTISASIDPAGSGTVTGSGTYQAGDTVTITAAPGDGYQFTGWQENGAVVSEEETYTFIVTGDRVLVAVFEIASLLPSGYTELEYIEALKENAISYKLASTYYKIQPGILLGTAQSNTVIKVSFYPKVFPTAAGSTAATGNTLLACNRIICITSAYTDAANLADLKFLTVFWVPAGLVLSVGSLYANVVRYANTTILTSTVQKWYDITIDMGSKQVIVDGAAYSFGTPQGGFPDLVGANVYLGSGMLSSNTATRLGSFYLKNFESTGLSNTLVTRRGIPAKNPSGVVGIYDIENKAWLGPALIVGSDTPQWSAGPAV